MSEPAEPDSDQEPLRLSLTLPGSASLGAFQAGAIAALGVIITTLRASGTTVRLDAIGGSSAGSIVSMLFAHCMVTGKDPVDLLREAWVDEVDVNMLKAGDRNAPLGFGELEGKLREFLGDDSGHPVINDPLEHPIIVHVGLTTLQGFTSPAVTGDTSTSTLSFADFVQYTLQPGDGRAALVEPAGASMLEAVLASASHPGGFAPAIFDRQHAGTALDKRGIDSEGTSDRRWYTDGGLVESQPVGRILAAARRAASGSGQRVHIVIDPRSSGVSGNTSWSDLDTTKSWIDGLRRSMSILPTQALHDDLRRVADVNDRLEAIDALATDLASSLGGDRDDLRKRLAEAAGLSDKEPVNLEMISPLDKSSDDESGGAELLAGDFIGAFGGFLNRQIRQSDFALGWESTVAWSDDAVARWRCTPDQRSRVSDALEKRHDESWQTVAPDGDGTSQLRARDRLRLASLGFRAGRILVSEALPSWSSKS